MHSGLFPSGETPLAAYRIAGSRGCTVDLEAFAVENNFLSRSGIEPRILRRPLCILITALTVLLLLLSEVFIDSEEILALS